MKQEEGVRLFERSSFAEEVFLIRSLRTRETWEVTTEAEATQIYDSEVAKSRDCSIVQKKLGGF
ncbi:hypothetical protein [Sphingobium sp. Sx8-8]|uniref:hypothetical protein n=1 Tax=Sphingobium sp. Sx8-8 TaxID=2933617 RepID=UPI001F57065B|nr:hypothetical protein [Sphingobium sp. Sx8-8]